MYANPGHFGEKNDTPKASNATFGCYTFVQISI